MYKSLAFAALAAVPALATPGVNVYWGQKGNVRLRDRCDQGDFEFITVGFVNYAPEADTTGLNYPGTNFAANCGYGYFKNGNGDDSKLLSSCTEIAEDIPYCQDKGIKVLLSIGGAAGDYEVSSAANGEYFAEFLFKAFGPYDAASTIPRPFDFGGAHVSVDGFDFDIEVKFDDNAGYNALIAKLHDLIDASSGSYIVTAAPECPLSEEYFKMKTIIDESAFDLLFVQFYNNPGCDATTSNFNFDAWVTYLAGTPSSGAKIFIGLPGDDTTESAGSGYLSTAAAAAIIEEYKNKPSFGGVSLWDVLTASNNEVAPAVSYLKFIHEAVVGSVSVPSSVAPSSVASSVASSAASSVASSAASS
ncbi:glycoside hydrolase superfamily, partial [Lasiosphaeris hirsuta]